MHDATESEPHSKIQAPDGLYRFSIQLASLKCWFLSTGNHSIKVKTETLLLIALWYPSPTSRPTRSFISYLADR